jgi:hypothetical protein
MRRTKPVSHPMFQAKQKELKEKEMLNEKKRLEPPTKYTLESHTTNSLNINPSVVTDTKDWTKLWKSDLPKSEFVSNPKSPYYPATGHYYTTGVPYVPPVHQPFTLTWNGQHYVPDFVPADIRVTAYHAKDYMELKKAFRELQTKADMATSVTQALDGTIKYLRQLNLDLCDRVDFLHEQLDAYKHVWSAREYLKVVEPDNTEAYRLLTDTMLNIRWESHDWPGIKERYARINMKGIDLSVRGKSGHEDSPEEHSI